MTQSYYEKNKEEISRKSKLRYRQNRDKKLAYQKSYLEANKEKIREYQRRWREANREKNLARKRQYYYENHDLVLEAQRQSRKKHIEKARKRESEYHRSHPEVLRASSSKRRAKIRGNQVDPAGIKAWMLEVRLKPFMRCHWCGTKIRGEDIHFDHVIAVNRGGSHTIGNLCCSCSECNASKHDRALTDWIRNGQRFLL